MAKRQGDEDEEGARFRVSTRPPRYVLIKFKCDRPLKKVPSSCTPDTILFKTERKKRTKTKKRKNKLKQQQQQSKTVMPRRWFRGRR